MIFVNKRQPQIELLKPTVITLPSVVIPSLGNFTTKEGESNWKVICSPLHKMAPERSY